MHGPMRMLVAGGDEVCLSPIGFFITIQNDLGQVINRLGRNTTQGDTMFKLLSLRCSFLLP